MMGMHEKIVGVGLGFDDVLLMPQRSSVRSRMNGNTDARVALNAPDIHVPIISANMDTVTEAKMATKIALLGGLGVIHRFMSIDKQVEEVIRVKNRMRIVEDHPPTLSADATAHDAIHYLTKKERGYIILSDPEKNTPAGLVSIRDLDSTDDLTTPLKQLMTPWSELIKAKAGTTLEQAVAIMKKNRLEKIPLVNDKDQLLGVYTMKDYAMYQEFPYASLDNKGKLLVAAAIGVQANDVERALQLVAAGVDILVLDIAHGGLDFSQEMIHELKIHQHITTPIVAGNIATKDCALYLRDSGADGIKVGIGPGFVCDTRDVAGVGVPQITAIMDVAEALSSSKNSLPIMADGGIRKPGDVAKAIGAGADTVMVGSLFAGTDESPGEIIEKDNVSVKMVRGMASNEAFTKRLSVGITTTQPESYTPEGHTTFVPYKGSTEKVLKKLRGGLLSGMSYSNAKTIPEMKQKAQFVVLMGTRDEKRPLS